MKYELLMTHADTGSTELVYHGKETSCRLHSLQPGRAYSFQVRALNDAGVSSFTLQTFSARNWLILELIYILMGVSELLLHQNCIQIVCVQVHLSSAIKMRLVNQNLPLLPCTYHNYATW